MADRTEGLHQAVCVDVWDIYPTKRDEQYGGGIVDQTRIVWQLDLESPEGRRYEVMAIYTASLHEKAKLRKHLESWRGRQFTQQELQGFELENVIGANCQIHVIHRLSNNGKTYANVQAIVPLGKGQVKIRASEDFVRRKDRQQAQPWMQTTNGGGSMEADDNTVPF